MLVSRSELSYYPEPEYELEKKPTYSKKKRVKKQRPKQRKTNSSIKLIYILIAMIFLGTSLFILSRYAAITLVRAEITNLEKETIELEKIKINLIADLEGIKSSSQIAEDARVKLGMGYPTEGQIAYISVENNRTNEIEGLNIQEQIKKAFNMVTSLF